MKHKITVEYILKWPCNPIFSDRIIMVEPFTEIKAYSLSFKGIQGLWKVPDEQRSEWMDSV